MIKELVIKELKNTLRDRKMLLSLIIAPLLMFIIMGGVMRFAMAATFKEALEKRTIYVVNNDLGKYSEMAIEYIREKGFDVKVFEQTNTEEILSKEEIDVIIEFPEGFSYNLSNGLKAKILTYTSIKGLSMGGYAVLGKVSGLINEINTYLSKVLVREVAGGIDPDFILNPVVSKSHMYISGKEVPETFMAMLGFFSAGIIVAPLVIVTTTIGISSSMIAVENEERTLEVLLTLPISRFKILLGKLIGVIILVLIATLSFLVGFMFYITAPIAAFEELPEVGEKSPFEASPILTLFDLQTIVLTVVAVFFTLIAVGSLGLLLGSIAPDVRTAQTYIGSLSFIIFIPGMMLMFMDLSKFTLAGQVALVALSPFISPILVFKALLEGVPWIAYASLIWTIAFTFIMVAIAAKFMETEKILTLQFTLKMKALRKKR